MKSRIAIVASAGVFSLLAAGTLTYTLWGSPAAPLAAPVAQAPQEWEATIRACLPPSDSTQQDQLAFFSDSVQDCLRNTYNAASKAGQVNAVADATETIIRDKVLLSMICHDLAHDSGQHTLDYFQGDVVAAVNAYNGNYTCEGGFLHGITDAWAKSSPPDEAYRAVGEACRRSNDSGNFYGICTHGYGHAAWIGRLDPMKAAQLCLLLDDPQGRSQCGEGIIMDLYQPAGSNIPHRPIELAGEEMPEICRTWPEPGTPGMLEGCVRGSAYIFARDVFAAMGDIDKYKPPFKDIPQEFYDNTSRAAKDAYDKCQNMDKTSIDQCQKDLAKFLVWRPSAALADPEVRKVVCSGLDGDLRDYCINLKYEII